MHKFDPKIYERNIYQESIYSAWLTYSDERDVLETVFREKVHEWCTKNNLSILDIGCGTGSAAKRVFKILDYKGISYRYTGVDPYKDQLEGFNETLAEKKSIKLITSKIEDFEIDKKYDLVLIVHALYYVDDIEQLLKKIYPYSKKMIIVHHGEYGINEVHEAFREKVMPGNNIISTFNKVAQTLDRLKISYKLNVYDTKINITPCKESKNKDGIKLIKFFLEHSLLNNETIKMVRKWLKNKPDIMTHNVGYFFINNNEK